MKEYSLAATAIRELWNQEQPILYFGEWCFLTNNDRTLRPDDKMLPFLFDTAEKTGHAILFCDSVYRKILNRITAVYNRQFGLAHECKYYEILLGSWLIHFIHQMYDKYSLVKKALDVAPDVETIYLAHGQRVIAADIVEYMDMANADAFAQQQFDMVFEFFEIPGTISEISEPLTQTTRIDYRGRSERDNKLHSNWLIEKITRILQKFFYSHHFILTSAYMQKSLRFSMYSRCRYVCEEFEVENMLFDIIPDWELRMSLELDAGDNDFEKLVAKFLFLNIPLVYLEGFQQLRESITRNWPDAADISYTATGYWSNTKLLFYLAENHDKTRRLCHQHGGNYGTDDVHTLEMHERCISDIYYSWGWKEDDKTIPLVSPRLSNLEGLLAPSNANRSPQEDSSEVVFFMTTAQRYRVRFQQHIMSSNFIYSYLDSIFEYLDELAGFQDKIRLRTHPNNSKNLWNEEQRVTRKFPAVRRNNEEITYYDQLYSARICVFGHIATTYLEAFIANKPTIIFIDRKIYDHRKNNICRMQLLEDAGILYYCPKQAAIKTIEIYERADEWWNDEIRQSAVHNYLDAHGRAGHDWMHSLDTEFRRQIQPVN